MSSSLLPTASAANNNDRIIALIDMDCFYVQVEEREQPSIKGKPAAVVQYNAWKGGGLIAVNYEARAKGVGRHCRGHEARATCPEIILVPVPELRGKADLTKYRNAGHEVIKVLCEFCKNVERASVDEAYIDLTELVESKLLGMNAKNRNLMDPMKALQNINQENLENCFVVPTEENSSLSDHSSETWLSELIKGEMMTDIQDVKLLLGAELVGQMRKAIFDKTSFRCSAGIAHNKILAKLGCGINKPNKQTIIPHSSVPELFKKTKVYKVRNFGGKLGDVIVEQFNCEFMNDLIKFSEKELINRLGSKCGAWVYQISRGFDDEVVTPRQLPKSIGCNKMFNGPEALTTKEKIKHWLQQLSAEVVERLQKDLDANFRRAKSLTLHVKFDSEKNTSHISKSCGTHVHYNSEKMAADAMAVMEKLQQSNGFHPVVNLGLIASKFEDEVDISNCSKIETFFTKSKTKSNDSSDANKPNSLITRVSDPAPCSSKTILNYNQPSSGTINSTEVLLENNSSNSADEKPKGFFNRNPSPRKKNPNLPSLPILNSSSKKKVKVSSKSAAALPTPLATSTPEYVISNNSSSLSSSNIPVATEVEKGISKSTGNINGNDAGESSSAFKSFSKDCEKCQKSIPVWDFICHMDWHMARDLQREINGLPPLNATPATSEKISLNSKRPSATSSSKNSRTKSKRGRSSKNASRSDTNGMKTLDNYFTQNNS